MGPTLEETDVGLRPSQDASWIATALAGWASAELADEAT
jgi:hypothetical protein